MRLEWNPLFDGAYGNQNAGDDAFCTIAAWGAKHYWGAQRIRFAAARLPVMPESVRLPAAQPIFAGKPLLRGYAYSLLTLIYRLIYSTKSSGIVYAGGSTLWNMPLNKHIFQQLTRHLGKPMVGIGLSTGPFKNLEDQQKVSAFLRQFSFLALRDLASYEEAKAMLLPTNPILAFDLAGLLPRVYGPVYWKGTTQNDIPILGVAVCHYERYHSHLDSAKEAIREKRIQKILVKLAQRHAIRVRFFIFNIHPVNGDLELTKKMATTLKPYCSVELISYANDPGQIWYRIGECQAFLGVRLHSAIFAYMAGVPCAIVEYHRKCTDFAEYIGLPDVYRFPSEGPDQDTAVEALTNLINAPEFAEMKPQDVQIKAELNFTSAPWYGS